MQFNATKGRSLNISIASEYTWQVSNGKRPSHNPDIIRWLSLQSPANT